MPMKGGQIAHWDGLAEQALPVGTTLSGDQFTITEHLGSGGFGITYRARDNVLGRTIVIKECFPTDLCFRNGQDVAVRNPAHGEQMRSIISMFMREARSLAKLRHPNVVGVHRAFEENRTAYMALDLIEGRDLADFLEAGDVSLSPGRVRDILLQLLDAIEKVHEVDLLHRDISPDNILIETSGTPVLIDFGSARGDASRQTRAISSLLVVKDGYSPQELYIPGSEQTPSSDLYALAATFYHVITGTAPANSQVRMVELAGNGSDPCLPLAGRIEGYDEAFLQAIDTAMQIHPAKRLQSAAKWKSLISDPESEISARVQGRARPSSKDLSLDLELSLTRLVEETNDEVRRISQIQAEAPIVTAPPKPPEAPEWIKEFNRDSEAALAPVEKANPTGLEVGPDAAPDSEATPAPDGPNTGIPPTNWVDRAREKQERLRLERMRELELFDDEPGEIAPRPASGGQPPAEDILEDTGAYAGDSAIVRPNRYRPLGIVFLLVCFCFVFFLETP